MRRNYGLSREQKERVWDLRLKGNTLAETAGSMGVTTRRVKYYVHAVGGIKPERPRSRSRRALCLAEREEISRGIAAGHSGRRIGGDLGRHHTTISREIGRCGGRGRYRAHHADDRAWRAQLRPRPGKLDSNGELAALVAGVSRSSTPPSRSRAGFACVIPTMSRCRSRMSRSTARSTCRPAAR